MTSLAVVSVSPSDTSHVLHSRVDSAATGPRTRTSEISGAPNSCHDLRTDRTRGRTTTTSSSASWRSSLELETIKADLSDLLASFQPRADATQPPIAAPMTTPARARRDRVMSGGTSVSEDQSAMERLASPPRNRIRSSRKASGMSTYSVASTSSTTSSQANTTGGYKVGLDVPPASECRIFRADARDTAGVQAGPQTTFFSLWFSHLLSTRFYRHWPFRNGLGCVGLRLGGDVRPRIRCDRAEEACRCPPQLYASQTSESQQAGRRRLYARAVSVHWRLRRSGRYSRCRTFGIGESPKDEERSSSSGCTDCAFSTVGRASTSLGAKLERAVTTAQASAIKLALCQQGRFSGVETVTLTRRRAKRFRRQRFTGQARPDQAARHCVDGSFFVPSQVVHKHTVPGHLGASLATPSFTRSVRPRVHTQLHPNPDTISTCSRHAAPLRVATARSEAISARRLELPCFCGHGRMKSVHNKRSCGQDGRKERPGWGQATE